MVRKIHKVLLRVGYVVGIDHTGASKADGIYQEAVYWSGTNAYSIEAAG